MQPMKKLAAALGACLALAAGNALAETPQPAQPLKVGDKAPHFDLESSAGGRYALGDRAVVLAWFPRAFTSGCTVECKSLAKNGHRIREFDADYVMASVDSIEDNTGFAQENGADFPILSDPTKSAARAYGVLHERGGFTLRHTFYIGADGTILAIDRDVKPATAAEDIIATLDSLGIPRLPGADAMPEAGAGD